MPEYGRALALRFAVVYLLLLVVVGALSVLLMQFAGLKFGSALSFVPVFGASIDAGRRYYKLSRRRPRPSESWRFAVLFTAISIALSLALEVLWFGPDFRHALSNPVVGLMMLVLSGMTLLASWFFFRLGAKVMHEGDLS